MPRGIGIEVSDTRVRAVSVETAPRTIRIILLLAAVPLGIASNIFRILTTAAGAYYLGPIALHNVIHMWNGTTVFLLTFGALAVLDAALRRFYREA